MNLFRTLGGGALLLLAGVGLNGCLNPPSFPVEPSIDFKEIRLTKRPRVGGQVEIDTLNFVLNFQDGDGDLGLSADDIKLAPYNGTTGGHNNRGYSYNYFIQPFIKDASGNFVPFVNSGSFRGEYDGRYPRLDGAETKPAPLKGDLRYKFPITLDNTPFRAGQVVRFEISILDRGLHESNKITTSEYTLGQ